MSQKVSLMLNTLADVRLRNQVKKLVEEYELRVSSEERPTENFTATV